VVLTAQPVNLSTDKVITLGLIVSELVTNAFKYAYADGHEGEIRVLVYRHDEASLELRVEDDGEGFEAGVPAKGTGLGTKLLTAMASSLKSSIVYAPDHKGTRAVVTFAIN
jgi:two-component sensor histidine kinase